MISMNSQVVTDFRKYKTYEKTLSAMIVFISVLSPIILASLLDHKLQVFYLIFLGVLMVSFTLGLIYIRTLISDRLRLQYMNLDVGATLKKKLTTNRTQFVIVNKTYQHFCLQDQRGLKILVPKHRIQEDFDIAN